MTGRRFGWRVGALIGALLLAALLSVAAVAHWRDQLSPSALTCRLDPLTLPLFDATPAATLATPAPKVDQEAAEPAPDDTRDEIEESVGVIVACANTGEPRYAFAVFTERYLADLFTGEDRAYQPAFERQLTQPPRPPEDPLDLHDVRDIELLPDGRAVATVVLDSSGQTFTDMLVLVDRGDTWLVDDVLEMSPEPF